MENTHLVRGGMVGTHLENSPAIVGTVNSCLRIERIGGDALNLLDRPGPTFVGESLLALVVEDDVVTCLSAYSDAAASQHGVTASLRLRARPAPSASPSLRWEVLILPLGPSSGYAFVLRPVTRPTPDERPSDAVVMLLNPVVAAVDTEILLPGRRREVSDCQVVGADRLTARELEIVTRLLDGHRPPGIARALFLSQSTVRNHLSSVFRKLGVTSQEELIELFRDAPPSVSAPERPTPPQPGVRPGEAPQDPQPRREPRSPASERPSRAARQSQRRRVGQPPRHRRG